MSIQYMVLEFEPMTFGRESPPITTRPGLSPKHSIFVRTFIFCLLNLPKRSRTKMNKTSWEII